MRKLIAIQVPVMLAVLWLAPDAARAQGFLLTDNAERPYQLPRIEVLPNPRPVVRPQPSTSYCVKQLSIEVDLQDQIAKTQVSQTFVNTGSRPLEVCFVYPLPYDGAVDRMTFMVDGKEFQAKLLSAAEARRIYEAYVRKNQDPALVEWMGNGMFKTSVFPVPAGAERTVTIRYSQLCRKHQGLTELLVPLAAARYTSKPVQNIDVQVTIRSGVDIKNVYSPTHGVKVKRPGDRVARVSYSTSNDVPSGDFRLLYDVGDAEVGASLITYRPCDDEHGYFLLMVGPEIEAARLTRQAKTVVLVVDRSGSMSGEKIAQAKGALRFVLNNLHDGDLFNIVAYDSEVESFRPELERFNDETRQAAVGFVESIFAGGSTNIDGALQSAFAPLKDDARPTYVVFLTDGLPTAGEKNEAQIVANARQRNQIDARLFSFGVGYDVNSRLLDKLSRACQGQSAYVRPNEDIEAQVASLYQRIGAPVLTDLKISFDMEDHPSSAGNLTNRVYPREVHDLFAGDQLVLVGRYRHGGHAKATIRGEVSGKAQKFAFPVEFASHSPDETFAFVEKLWAMRRIGEIIDEVDLNGRNQELIDELVALSKKHGVITPYTSFLADETTELFSEAEQRRRTGLALDALGLEAGRAGFAQREYKLQLQRSAQLAASSPAYGATTYRRIDRDEDVVVQSVRNVADKTFYYRSNRWVDATMSDEQAQQVQRVARFGDEYFRLIREHGKAATKYLAMDGDVVVVLDGQAYEFHTPAPEPATPRP